MADIPRPASAQSKLPSQADPPTASNSTSHSTAPAVTPSAQLQQVRHALKEKKDAIDRERAKWILEGSREQITMVLAEAPAETAEQRSMRSRARRAEERAEGRKAKTETKSETEASGRWAWHTTETPEGHRVTARRTFVLTLQDIANFQKLAPPTSPPRRTLSETAVPDAVDVQNRLRALTSSQLGRPREQTPPRADWQRIWARGEQYFRPEAWDHLLETLKAQAAETGTGVQVAAANTWWAVKAGLWDIGASIGTAITVLWKAVCMVVCSTWWTTLYKAALYYGFLFYMFLALLYVVLGIYRSSTNSIPGLRTISRYASAPVVFAVCSVPGVRMVDDSLYSLCAPIVTKDRPKGPRKARRIDGPRATRNTTEVLYEFAALCTPEFWEETLKLGNHLTDLSSSFSTLRTPYERLYARWKYTVSAELRARRLPAVMPLLSVVESIDAAAKGLISLESNIVSAWIRVETTIGFFREKLAIAAARTSWIPGARRKKADKVLSEYAHQCEIVIEQLTVLIKFIQSVIALFEELGKRLDNVREAILLVEEVRLRDLESQWFWIRHWRTSDLSTLRTVFGLFPSMSYSASSAEKGIAVKESYFLETLQISAITATNEQMMAELVTMLTFLERKLVTWSEFKRALLAHPTDPNGDVSGTGAAAGGGGGGRMRGREEELNMELHIRLVDQMWEQYKRSSQLAWRDLMKGRAREGGEEDGEPERVGG